MSKSVKQIAKESGVTARTVQNWIKKGYFGAVQREGNKGYVFSDDMPLPYSSNGKAEKDTALLQILLEASDLGRSVHRNMFPRIDAYRYQRILDYAADSGLVEIRRPYPEVTQLLSTKEGRTVIRSEPKVQKQVLEMVLEGIKVTVAIAQIAVPLFGK